MSNSKLIPLGSQGLQSSRIGFGGMSIGIKRNWNGKDLYGKKVPSKKGIHELIATLKDNGINHIDTAQIYKSILLLLGCCCGTYSESLLSGPIKDLGRDNFIVATKVAVRGKDKFKLESVKKTCYESLKRLGIDCLDLLYMHRIPQNVPIEDCMEKMNELKKEGKIKYVGLSEASSKTIRRAHAVCPISCVQMEWSLFARDLEDGDVIDTCRELKIGIVCYSPLGRGMLTNTVNITEALKDGMDYRKMGAVKYAAYEQNGVNLAKFQTLADAKNVTCATLGLAWLIKHGNKLLDGAGVVPIPGSRSAKHIAENAAAIALADTLTDDDMAKIEEAFPEELYSNKDARYGNGQGGTLWHNDNNPEK